MIRGLILAVTLGFASPALSLDLIETPSLRDEVFSGRLPTIGGRIPQEPLVVDLEAKGRSFGVQGGTLRTLIAKAKDIRYMVVYGYARLVGYDSDFKLQPDILRKVIDEGGRSFTLVLRKGHKWSDGAPFTTEDFRYWWEDVANNPELSPNGPPELMMMDGEPPVVEVLDETHIRYTWSKPNPRFIPALAKARPLFIYRPAHYMKQFHADYADPEKLRRAVADAGVRNWAQLHNKRDNLYKFDNPDLPTLQPWMNTSAPNSQRFVLQRNPYFHRIDARGRQLPYIDTVEVTVAASGLIAAKANAGQADLQSRGLSFTSIAFLKHGEKSGGYHTFLWSTGNASHIALFPNLNYADPGWRAVLRDARFRHALSLAIDRRIINRSLYFGLAREGNVSVLSQSPFYDPANTMAYAQFDLDRANALLDEMGLTERRGDGVRLLPDGRPLEVVVETAGERPEEIDALELVGETWKEIGVKMILRPLDRDILRNRVYAGRSMMPVWMGWDNGVPTPNASPEALAPVTQNNFSWPRWGQYYQSSGKMGEAPDMPEARHLLDLYHEWEHAESNAQRGRIWREMLAIHARETYEIGIVYETPQPIVVSNKLRNVPEKALYAWMPGAYFGVYRIGEFYFADPNPDLASDAPPHPVDVAPTTGG